MSRSACFVRSTLTQISRCIYNNLSLNCKCVKTAITSQSPPKSTEVSFTPNTESLSEKIKRCDHSLYKYYSPQSLKFYMTYTIFILKSWDINSNRDMKYNTFFICNSRGKPAKERISRLKIGQWKLCVCARSLQSFPIFATLWTVACQAPLSMGSFKCNYWSGLPCPPPGDLPDPGTELASLISPVLAGGFYTISATWELPAEIRSVKTQREK